MPLRTAAHILIFGVSTVFYHATMHTNQPFSPSSACCEARHLGCLLLRGKTSCMRSLEVLATAARLWCVMTHFFRWFRGERARTHITQPFPHIVRPCHIVHHLDVQLPLCPHGLSTAKTQTIGMRYAVATGLYVEPKGNRSMGHDSHLHAD